MATGVPNRVRERRSGTGLIVLCLGTLITFGVVLIETVSGNLRDSPVWHLLGPLVVLNLCWMVYAFVRWHADFWGTTPQRTRIPVLPQDATEHFTAGGRPGADGGSVQLGGEGTTSGGQTR